MEEALTWSVFFGSSEIVLKNLTEQLKEYLRCDTISV